MGIYEQLRKENEEYDPHGLKRGFENTPRHAHVNTPYEYAEYPKAMSKKIEDGDGVRLHTLTAKSKEHEDELTGRGYQGIARPDDAEPQGAA